jgi:hypothetical protein
LGYFEKIGLRKLLFSALVGILPGRFFFTFGKPWRIAKGMFFLG